MTITITPALENRLRRRADDLGRDVNELVEALIVSALDDPDELDDETVAEIRAGIDRGLEAAKQGRERPLSDYIADVMQRRSRHAADAA